MQKFLPLLSIVMVRLVSTIGIRTASAGASISAGNVHCGSGQIMQLTRVLQNTIAGDMSL